MATQKDIGAKPTVVVAGLGDTGLLAAIELASEFTVIGISPKSCLVSGQALGTRLSQPQRWTQNYLMDFRRFKKLDGVSTMQARVISVDPQGSQIEVENASGEVTTLAYDALILASGVSNGFWREPSFQSRSEVMDRLARRHQTIAEAQKIAIIGGGASGVSCAANIATVWPDKAVGLYFSGSELLPGFHAKVRERVHKQLLDLGVQLHSHHRAELPSEAELARVTSSPVHWSSGQAPIRADCVLWTVGKVRPNSSFIPSSMLNAQGFVRVDEFLRVPGYPKIFAVGDLADSDPQRSSARNWGFRTVAHNVRMVLRGDDAKMKPYKSSPHRWGSVVGVQPNGLEVFQPNGGRFRFPRWLIDVLVFPLFVNTMIYRGVRPESE